MLQTFKNKCSIRDLYNTLMEYLDLGTDVVDPGDLAQIRRIQNGRTNGLRSLLVLLDSSSSRKSTRTDHNLSMVSLR